MPVFEIQHGNRTFEIEADSEPSPEDLDLALKGVIPQSNALADMGRRALKSANTGAKQVFTSLANASDAVSETFGWDKSENKFFRTRSERAAQDAAEVKTDSARDNEIKSMIAEGVGGAAPAILAGAVSPVIGVATMAGQSGEATREKALAEGDSEGVAAEKAKLGRLGGAVMGLIPGQLARPGAKILERAGSGAVTGAAINAAQEGAMELAVDGELNPESMKRAAVVGGAMGGAFGAASRGGKAKDTAEEPPASDKAVESINAGIVADAAKEAPAPQNGFTPKEIAAEVVKAKPEVLESLRRQIARGDEVDFQYSVWDKEMVPEGAPRDLQIDIIPKNPNEEASGGLGSTNRKVLAGLGVDLPPVPDWVPAGSYTKADMEALIKQGPPPAGTELVFESAPPKAQALDAAPEPTVQGAAPDVGLGAAAPAEFSPAKEFTTSVKNEAMDAEAVARGQEPAMSQARKTNPQVWDEAMAKIDEDQNYPDRLIAELKEKPRAIDASDQLVLAHRNIELQNDFNKAERNISENIGTPDSLAADRVTQERVLDEMIDVRNAIKQAGGSEVGRSLQIRKALINEDFSLATMLAEQTVAKGEKLTPEESTAVREQFENIQKAEKELADNPSSRPPEEAHLDEEANRRIANVELAKEEFMGALEKERYKQKSKAQKALYQTGNVIDFIRALKTTGEFSFIGRQGFTNLMGHPIRTARSIPDTVRALFADEVVTRAIDKKTQNDPFAKTAEKYGVFLDDPYSLKSDDPSKALNAREEAIASRWSDKVPGIRNFNQAARVFLNRMRLESFKDMVEANPGIDEDGLKALASFTNVGTGRGSLGEWGNKHALQLARVSMFSPRFVASRIQYTLGTPLWGGNLASRKTIAREYARTVLGAATFYTLYEMARDKDDKTHPPVSFDPRSSNFGKIKLGKATLDPLAGLAQAVVWESRNALTLADSLGVETGGQTVDGKGKLRSLRKPAFGQQDWVDMNLRFARSKLAPIPGAIVNGMLGQDFVGQPTTWANEAADLVRPMTWVDLYQAFGEHDMSEYSSIALMGLLGAGIQNEIDRGKSKAGRQTIDPVDEINRRILEDADKQQVAPARPAK